MEAARRQLRTALELWFSGGDEVSTQALAYASHEIIHKLFRRKGHSNLIYDTTALTVAERKKFTVYLKEGPNFIKHSNSGDPGERIMFSENNTDLLLIMSVVGLHRMGEKLNEIESTFMFWLYLHNPGWFVGEEVLKKRAPVERIAELRRIKKIAFPAAWATFKREIGAK